MHVANSARLHSPRHTGQWLGGDACVRAFVQTNPFDSIWQVYILRRAAADGGALSRSRARQLARYPRIPRAGFVIAAATAVSQPVLSTRFEPAPPWRAFLGGRGTRRLQFAAATFRAKIKRVLARRSVGREPPGAPDRSTSCPAPRLAHKKNSGAGARLYKQQLKSSTPPRASGFPGRRCPCGPRARSTVLRHSSASSRPEMCRRRRRPTSRLPWPRRGPG